MKTTSTTTVFVLSLLAGLSFALPADPNACQVQPQAQSQPASKNQVQSQSSTDPVPQYQQCGGTNWTGATKCADGLMCMDWNPYYSQCITPLSNSQNPPSSSPQASPTAPAYAPSPTSQPDSPPPSQPTGSTGSSGSAGLPAGGEKMYTLDTFVAYLEKEAGGDMAANVRRMIEALQEQE